MNDAARDRGRPQERDRRLRRRGGIPDLHRGGDAPGGRSRSHSLYGDRVKEIVFEEREGGEVYELTETGEKGHWATVLAWEPPNRLVLAWKVSPSVVGTEVEVRFLPEDEANPGRARAPGLGARRRGRAGEARRLRHRVGLRARHVRRAHLEQLLQRSEPAKPLVPRDGGIRWRGRRQDEELRLAEHALLEPVLRTLAERCPGRRPCRRTR